MAIITRTILKEDAESASQKKAMEYAQNVMGLEPSSAEDYVRKTVRTIFPYLNGNRKAGKYTLGLLRLSNTEVKNIRDRMKLNSYLEAITNNQELYTKLDRNFNDLSFGDLIRIVQEYMPELGKEEKRAEVKAKAKKSPNYTIKPIKSYSEANEYYGKLRWCICGSIDRFESYGDNGLSQFYFCFHKDMNKFKNDRTPVFTTKRGHKLNAYALSALAICVDIDGNLKSCTTRLNHDNDCIGNSCGDHELNVEEIEQVLGVNFKDTFKVLPAQKKKHAQFEKYVEKLKTIKSYEKLDDAVYRNEFVEDTNGASNVFSVTLSNGYDLIFTYDEDETKVEYKFTSKVWSSINENDFLYLEDGIIKHYKDGKISNIDNYSGDTGELVIHRFNPENVSAYSVRNEDGIFLIYNSKTGKKKSFKGEEVYIVAEINNYAEIKIGDDDDVYLFNLDTLKVANVWDKDFDLDALNCYGDYYYFPEWYGYNPWETSKWKIEVNKSIGDDEIGMLYDSKFKEYAPFIQFSNDYIYNPNIGLMSYAYENILLDYKNIQWYADDISYGLLINDKEKGIVCIIQEDLDTPIIVIDNIKEYYVNENLYSYFLIDKDGKKYDTYMLKKATKDKSELIADENYQKDNKYDLSKKVNIIKTDKISIERRKDK